MNQSTTLHTFNINFTILRVDNNTPMCALGDTAWTRGQIFTKILSSFMNLQVWHFYHYKYIAWTRGRIFTKFLSIFMNLEKSVIFTICQQFEWKHNVTHLQLIFYPRVKSQDFSLSTFGDLAWKWGGLDRRTDRRKRWNLYSLVSRGIITPFQTNRCFWNTDDVSRYNKDGL